MHPAKRFHGSDEIKIKLIDSWMHMFDMLQDHDHDLTEIQPVLDENKTALTENTVNNLSETNVSQTLQTAIDEKFDCPGCHRSFSKPSHLNSHKIIHEPATHCCIYCQAKYFTDYHLDYHLQTKHPDKVKVAKLILPVLSENKDNDLPCL
jgi:hypothetical protein